MKFQKISEQLIKKAIEKGQFEDLPGKGKPIDWPAEEPVLSEDWMAHHVLKNANMLPSWIEIDKELRGILDKWEQAIPAGLESAGEYRKYEFSTLRLLEKLNQEAPEQIALARWARIRKLKEETKRKAADERE